MNPVLAKRFARRMLPVLPFIVAIFAFHIHQDLQRGEPLPMVLLLNGVPLILLGLLFTGILWFLGRPVEGIADAEAAIESRRAPLMRRVAIVSLVIHGILAVALLIAATR